MGSDTKIVSYLPTSDLHFSNTYLLLVAPYWRIGHLLNGRDQQKEKDEDY